MRDEEFAEFACDAGPPAAPPGGSADAAGWRRIAQLPVQRGAAGPLLGEELSACLPAALVAAGLRAAIEQAVLTALARRERQTGRLPHTVVVSQHAGGAASAIAVPSEGGWSFFVVERPAHAMGGGAGDTGDTVELCLYCDA